MRIRKLAFLFLLTSPWMLYAQLQDIKVGSSTRNMIVHVPANLASGRPLLLSLHGLNQDAPYQQSTAKWESIADTAKFALVYPNAINKSWDISGDADINFLLAIIDTMYNRHKIDKNRVYVSGFSMGGMMSYHTANKIGDKVAAIGPVSGYLFSNAVSSVRPMPIIHVHGDADNVVNYPGVASMLEKWRTLNKCPSTATTIQPYPANKPGSTGIWQHWGPCDQSEVALITIRNAGHWHSNDAAGVHSSHEIWNFLKKWSLTGATNSSSSSTVPSSSSVAVPQAAYSSASLPGTIEAENFDLGGEGVAYHDSDPANNGAVYRSEGVDITGDAANGYQTGWTVLGEWFEYTLHVAMAGNFNWEARVSAGGDGSSFRMTLDSTMDISGLVAVPNTGSWDTYTTVTGSTPVLSVGKHILRIAVEGAYWNMDWIRFSEPPSPLLRPLKSQAIPDRLPRFDLLGRTRR